MNWPKRRWRNVRPPGGGACWILLCLFALLSGCSPHDTTIPDRVIPDPHASGLGQAGLHNQILPHPLRVVVEGPLERGLLGGAGSRKTIPGVDVQFTIENPGSGAVFVESDQPVVTVATDVSGTAAVTLQLGNRSTDITIRAVIATPRGERSTILRATSGVELIGHDLEGRTGDVLDEFGLIVQEMSGAPAEGVPVYFRTEGSYDGSSVGRQRVLTDESGRAVTTWKLGTKVKQYHAVAEIHDDRADVAPEDRVLSRAFEFTAMAINKQQMLIVLLGGLAIFVFGMKLMTDGLQRMADRRLQGFLQLMTRNRFVAVLVGAGITAMIQSSSATTVMTVGFVNAGLLTLTQAIGVIFGANIGTTITAQIIAFRLEQLSYPAIAMGLLMSGFMKKPQYKYLGEAILGFGLLFLGMQTMAEILKPLRDSPEFVAWFRTFDCTPGPSGMVPAGPALMCIVIGTITTVAVQSSTATMGLVLALASQGLINFYTAVPLILGDNIGTTITAILASIGTNRNAKRAAIAHTLFNLFGAAYMYALLFVPIWNGKPVFLGFVDAITPGNPFLANPENLLRHVANSHTAFNLINCLMFTPFIGLMARVCRTILPVTEGEEERVLEYLEPKLLNLPTVALRQTVVEVAYMLRRGQKSVNSACELFYGTSPETAAKIREREEVIDRLQREITRYLVELSRRQLSPQEASLIPVLIHAVNDAERIGDRAEAILELSLMLEDRTCHFSATAQEEVKGMQALLNLQFETTLRLLEGGENGQVRRVFDTENKITAFLKRATDAHMKRLEGDACQVHAGIIFLDLMTHLERVGDHLVNIAERASIINSVAEPLEGGPVRA
jgi:phosphate:Na+ symporter